jgi:hypothetical protein
MENSGTLGIKLKSAITLLQRVVIAFASMVAVILGLFLAYSKDVGSAVTCLTTGIVLFVFSNLELFESIKAPWLEATMRKIDAKVQEVEALAKKVASTSSVTAEFCMEIMVRIGRLSGPLPRPQALQLVMKMRDQLRTLDVDEATIVEIMKPWNEIIGNDLIRVAHDRLQHTMRLLGQGLTDKLREVAQPIDSNDPQYRAYVIDQEKFNNLHSLTLNFQEAVAVAKVAMIRNLYDTISVTYGEASIDDRYEVLQAIREADYFMTTGNFLTQQFWLEHDPMKITH